MAHTIAEIAAALGAEAVGDLSLRVGRAAEPAMAGAADLALAMDPRYADGLAEKQVIKRGDVIAYLPDDFHHIETPAGSGNALHLHFYGLSLEHLPDRVSVDMATGTAKRLVNHYAAVFQGGTLSFGTSAQ